MGETSLNLEDAILFKGLSREAIGSFGERLQPRSFSAGDQLLEFGKDSPGLFIIGSGLVATIVPDGAGREREVASLGKGECVGEMALMTGEPVSAGVRAITDTEAWLIEPGDFIAIVERYPGIWRNLGRVLSQRLIRTSRSLTAGPQASTAALLMDCADDETACMAVAIAASLARQTGKRILLVDARAGCQRPASHLAPGQAVASLAEILRDPTRVKQHELAPERSNELSGIRLADIDSGDGPGLTEDEVLTALDWLRPLYDHVLFLVRREEGDVKARLLERARTVLAIVTQPEGALVPPWVASLCREPDTRQKLTVAMMISEAPASAALEAVEEAVGRPVRRLAVTGSVLQEVARERAFASEAPHYLPFRQSVDRLARHIGEMEVGLALGAGAAKGFAHIGVLRVLEENAIPIDLIAGCSIGAIVGALYAGGWSLPSIERRLQGADRKIRRWTLPLRSIWSDVGLKEILREPAPTLRFRDLGTPFVAVACDIATGRDVVLRKGLVWKAVQASVSVPGILPPVVIAGRHLVDGGLVNPVPSQTVRRMGANIVVAVDLMSPAALANGGSGPPERFDGGAAPPVPNLVEILWRSNEIMQEEVTVRSAATADVAIEPKLGRVRWSDFSHRGRAFVTAGEEAAREKLPELRRLLPFVSAGEQNGP
jgi:NTE family protein